MTMRAFIRRASSPGVALLVAASVVAGCRAESRDEEGRARRSVARPADVRATPAPPPRLRLGRTATAEEVAAWDIDVGADGRSLPAGRGTYAAGARVYAQKCAACHGARGEGMGQGSAAVPRLVGREPREGFPFAQDLKHAKTVGNYWPYATTLFDYVRRAMPITAPGTLTNDETYAIVAYLLTENEIVAKDAVMDAAALRAVRMPARDRFVVDDRKGGTEFR